MSIEPVKLPPAPTAMAAIHMRGVAMTLPAPVDLVVDIEGDLVTVRAVTGDPPSTSPLSIVSGMSFRLSFTRRQLAELLFDLADASELLDEINETPERADGNRCQLTECLGKSRCQPCLVRDRAYSPHQPVQRPVEVANAGGGGATPCVTLTTR